MLKVLIATLFVLIVNCSDSTFTPPKVGDYFMPQNYALCTLLEENTSFTKYIVRRPWYASQGYYVTVKKDTVVAIYTKTFRLGEEPQ